MVRSRSHRRSAEISLDLANYVRTVCAMLDIPVYGSLTEARPHGSNRVDFL